MDRTGLPIIVDKDSLMFGPEVAEALGHPPHIQIKVNEKQKSILLQPCDINDSEVIVVPPKLPFAVRGQSLMKTIRRLTGWTDKKPRVLYGYEVKGINAIVFNLMNAEVIQDAD